MHQDTINDTFSCSYIFRYVRFLDDRGKGKPPLTYLAAVENGLREHGKDIHSMGTNALRSRHDWNKVPLWKNRGAYISVCRYKAGKGSYHQWDNFLLEDFLHRKNCGETFLRRHVQLRYGMDSAPFKGLVQDPPGWSHPESSYSAASNSNSSQRSKKGGRGSVKVDPKLDSKPDSDSESCQLMMFDRKTGQMVPVHSVEED